MSKNLIIETNHDYFRENLNKYTRKAFQMLPELEKPRILDIGCGSGVPTIELARLSDGEIIGIDTDESLLDKLGGRIEEEGFSDRVKIKKCSLFEMDFPDASFDIVWAEGAIYIIGFERGLREWRRLLKTDGFLVVHDKINDVPDKLKKIRDCGYRLMNFFLLPEDAWWTEYYEPLEIQVKKLGIKYKSDPKALKILRKIQSEINAAKRRPKELCSVFYIMQKLQES